MTASALLLVPGLNCTAALWRSQIAPLSALCPVGVADHRGVDTMGGIAAAILAVAPPRFALAGLSMGGYVALEIWRTAPERVERLALLDTQARPDGPDAAENRRRQIAIAESGGFARIADLQLPKLLAPAHQGDPDLVAVVRAMAADTGAEAFVRQQRAILGRIDSRPTLATITCPTTVVVGAEDALTPPDLAREMVAAIPGASLEIIDGAGHLSPLEAPDAVTAVLRAWLAASE
ncbi:alpha/beta fold hydrolase [Siculibacillus lacustris]|uniref:Alpha/beta fold hydrolase n=1 Tax=Siculibacillus lacustris TaxID=1549641 RepID=A0A4Q9VFY0_9HYPH|nr:alpha/beta fold hydrolase [Siculibacillus lacustris]TBW33865.1 alpha/beta fold hydrolase [Siculibacillus lacustris]